MIASAAASILKLSANGSLSGFLSIVSSDLEAPDVDPTILSPREKVPLTELTSKTLVVAFQDLTTPVAPETEPVTDSLNAKVPLPPVPGAAMLIVGATEYPRPAFVMLIAVIAPEELTTAVAAADTVVTPDLNTSFVNVICGADTYPPPAAVTVMIPTP